MSEWEGPGLEDYREMVKNDEVLRETMEMLGSADLTIRIEPTVTDLTMAEFTALMDGMHLPIETSDGKVCKTCDPAQGWPCITRVLLDSTEFP